MILSHHLIQLQSILLVWKILRSFQVSSATWDLVCAAYRHPFSPMTDIAEAQIPSTYVNRG